MSVIVGPRITIGGGITISSRGPIYEFTSFTFTTADTTGLTQEQVEANYDATKTRFGL